MTTRATCPILLTIKHVALTGTAVAGTKSVASLTRATHILGLCADAGQARNTIFVNPTVVFYVAHHAAPGRQDIGLCEVLLQQGIFIPKQRWQSVASLGYDIKVPRIILLDQTFSLQSICIAWYHYSTANCLQALIIDAPIVRPWGWDMGICWDFKAECAPFLKY